MKTQDKTIIHPKESYTCECGHGRLVHVHSCFIKGCKCRGFSERASIFQETKETKETNMANHNHEIKQPENGELYHPDSDPRKLFDSCPACQELMINWQWQIQNMMNIGA